MGKVNPEIHSELKNLLHKVDMCGAEAAKLIARGMSKDDLKMVAKRELMWPLGNYAANIIFAVILEVWG